MTQIQLKQKKVKFFFVGIGKCGTSWIYEIVRRKNLMSVPKIKEPYLIDQTEARQEKLVQTLYDSFENMADFSNSYYWDQQNAAKIYRYNPNSKIVITIRRPSRRIKSHFEFLKRNGSHTRSTLGDYLADGDCDHLISRSKYRPIIERYSKQFGAHNVLVLPLEQLKNDAQAYFDRLAAFCGHSGMTLTEADKSPVLSRAAARIPWIAFTAKKLAQILRQFGMLRLLGSLKDSKIIQRILFSPTSHGVSDTNFGVFQSQIEQLDRDYDLLLDELGLSP